MPMDELELDDADILDAMTRLPGYVDISTEDFRALYHLAYRHATERLAHVPVEPTSLRAQEPPRPPVSDVAWSWIGAMLGIAAVAIVNVACFGSVGPALMLGSFGATAVLVYGAYRSPLAQPRNVLGGHVLSAIVGVLCWRLVGEHLWFAEALAVATSIALMHVTRTLHPPGGATALIAVAGSADIHRLGFLYVLVPATVGPIVLLLVALLVNNLPRGRRYPEVWF